MCHIYYMLVLLHKYWQVHYKFATLAHCDKLFSGGWMDSNSIIKVGLCGTHLHSHCKSLKHFITTHSDHVNSNNLQLFTPTVPLQ